ncbi:putative receptor-like serine/threonine-protein kinase [Iris pallida]|uniref:Receptor-like serine/threonine-protein kinase n=2 Tax=Iris pallida TaxID=29817 RepID=A0AAX6FVN3_IRIPA|nr:putative receptor-like serine/threonine-protein kinase [Iris pallida]
MADEESRPTIRFEEAFSRELEHRRRISNPGSQELPREQSLAGIKRKLVLESLPPVPPIINGPKLPPKQSEDHQARLKLQFQHPPVCQLQQQTPSVEQVDNWHSSSQVQQFRQSLPPALPQNRLPLRRNLQPSTWCNVCKLNCESTISLKQHRQGKKHKAKMMEVYEGKKIVVNEPQMLWCKECNVPCIDANSLSQHRAGKKHAAKVQALQAQNSAFGARVTYGPR